MPNCPANGAISAKEEAFYSLPTLGSAGRCAIYILTLRKAILCVQQIFHKHTTQPFSGQANGSTAAALSLWERQSYWKGDLLRAATAINPRSRHRGVPVHVHKGPSCLGAPPTTARVQPAACLALETSHLLFGACWRWQEADCRVPCLGTFIADPSFPLPTVSGTPSWSSEKAPLHLRFGGVLVLISLGGGCNKNTTDWGG